MIIRSIKFIGLAALIGLSLAFAWLIVSLISKFSPVQLTPESYSYVISPPGTDISDTPAKIARASIDYAGFVSILLSLISALLAALGLGIAVLAVIGWNSITGKVEITASQVINKSIADGEIKKVVTASLREGGSLHEVVKQRSREVMFEGVESVPTFDSTKPSED